jgi:phosphopantetheine adenylyltransferase
VNRKRAEKDLGQLEVYVIDVIASELEDVASDEGVTMKDLTGREDEKELKELKMGSTAIRQWIKNHGAGDV